MQSGTVKKYDRIKGFGFIEGDDGIDYFVHIRGLRVDLQKRGLHEDERVLFDIRREQKGDKAINVRLQ